MKTSLLTTKLNIPPTRPVLVSRSRLLECLHEGLGYSLVLISAPAGFGKTTLLSEWARFGQPEIPTAWISLDEGDNDPIRFWGYFIAAMQTLQPHCGEKMLPLLHSSMPPSTESMLTVLLNDLSSVKGNFVIVLDDYHLIRTQQIHDGISYLVEYLPTQFHLVIASRADPPLPLARFRGKGIMLEIHTDDLRFTHEDTASLLKELKTQDLSDSDIVALNERTEGWVVGLKMAALSMKERKDISGFITAFTGSQRYIMDYLMEEVLQNQSQDICDFLVKTSILERFTGPLCDSINKRKNSQEILLNLDRSHLFIVPLDESRQWYRFEHLFTDLLKHQCETVYGKEQVTSLHRQASQWYEDNNLLDEAIHHAIEGKDWGRAIRIIDVQHEVLQRRGEFNTLVGWIQAIPHEILIGHLRLYSKYTSYLAAVGKLELAETALSYLETVARDDITLQGQLAYTRGIICRYRGNTKACIELFEKAFTLLPPDDVSMRSKVAASIAHIQQRNSNFQEAEKWATKACELGQQAGDFMVVSGAWSQIGIVNTYQGKMKHAVMAFTKSNDYAKQKGLAVGDYSMLCWVQYILNNLEAVSENARLAIVLNQADLTALFYQAQICLVRGDEAGADVAMEKLDKVSSHPTIDSHWYGNYIAFRVIYAIQRDNIEEVARWSERLPDLAEMMLVARPYLARLLLAQGKREEANKLLQELYKNAIQLGAMLMATQIRIFQALTADNEESALEFLSEALINAAPEGIIRLFIDESKLLQPLLEKALAQQITHNFTKKLLDIIEEEERLRRTRKQTTPLPVHPNFLSEREMEVLRLLADDIPNQHISEKLNISLGTVKTHVHHIIDKLEVKDRRQAVQRAKELKLI